MRCLLLVIAIGCGGGNAVPDAADPAVCTAAFESSLDRACSQPGDCVLVIHDDCCGVVKLGVRTGSEAAAMMAEAQLRECYPCPALGCAHPDEAEDHHIAGAGQSIVATCVSQRCTSVVQ